MHFTEVICTPKHFGGERGQEGGGKMKINVKKTPTVMLQSRSGLTLHMSALCSLQTKQCCWMSNMLVLIHGFTARLLRTQGKGLH